MASAVSVDQEANRADLFRKVALVHQVRRLAEEIESVHLLLDHAGALAEIRRYSQVHCEQIPDLDLLQTAKTLRCYAGTLSSLTGAKTKSKAVTNNQ